MKVLVCTNQVDYLVVQLQDSNKLSWYLLGQHYVVARNVSCRYKIVEYKWMGDGLVNPIYRDERFLRISAIFNFLTIKVKQNSKE